MPVLASGSPSIASLSLSTGAVGTPVTITGANFGTTQGTSTVTFNGTAVTQVDFWHPASITVLVPTGATTGNVVVTVGGQLSNAISYTVNAATYHYVDNGRSANGTGTAASPWKAKSDIQWATITTELATSDVVIYFSSRSRWNDPSELHPVGGSASHRITLDGKSFFNSAATGPASWQVETTPWPALGSDKATWRAMYASGTTNAPTGCATFGSTTTRAGGTYFDPGRSYQTFRGFCLDNPNYGITFGLGGHNEIDMHDRVIEFTVVDTPSQQGIYAGGATAGAHDWLFSHNTVMDTNGEAIYVGEFDFYLGNDCCGTGNLNLQCSNPGPCADSITNVVVEFSTIIDAGSGGGEGDIDIKPGVFGAVVRFNVSFGTGTGKVQGGNTAFASAMRIYGNHYYNLLAAAPAENGYCIYVTSAGAAAGQPTHPIVDLTIYDNLCHGSYRAISFDAQGAISNVIFASNTFVGTTNSPALATSGPAAVTFTTFADNILSQNNTTEIQVSAATVFSSSPDFNLLYHPADVTKIAAVNGVNKSWAQWQALGFDAHGVNVDPSLDGSYVPLVGSPAIDAGTDLSGTFTTDKNGTARPLGTAWDIGAFEVSGAPRRYRFLRRNPG